MSSAIISVFSGAHRVQESHYMTHLRDMIHNLPYHLFQNRLDAVFLHDVFCYLGRNSAYQWYHEVVNVRGGKASIVHLVGLPVGDGRVLSLEDIETLTNFHKNSVQLRQENNDGKLTDKKFDQFRVLLEDQFNQCLFKLVQAQFFKVCRPTVEMASLPDYDPVEADKGGGVFSHMLFWKRWGRPQFKAPWMKTLSETLKPVPFYLNLPAMETHYLFLFFSILDRLGDRAFIKKIVAEHVDLSALSDRYVGKYAGMAKCDKITVDDLESVKRGSGNALAKIAKAVLFDNYDCYQKRDVWFKKV